MKPIKSFALGVAVLAAATVFAQGGPPVSVVIDGNPVQFQYQQPEENNDRVMVPLRGVFEKLGAVVNWNPANQTITAHKRGAEVRLAIGQLDASVDGRPVHLDVAATLVGGTTMVPLRFVSEALGAHVTWNASAHEVDIRSSTNYDIPNRAQPPVVHRTAPAPRPMRFAVIPAFTVLPFALDTRLSSLVAQRGDQFTATLNTSGGSAFEDLPSGTTLYGTVTYVHRRDNDHPGALELGVSRLALPNGRNLQADARIVFLDNADILRTGNGTIRAREKMRWDHVMFTGNGNGLGTVVGYSGARIAADADWNRVIRRKLGAHPRAASFRDVELTPGTQIGLLLYGNLNVPR